MGRLVLISLGHKKPQKNLGPFNMAKISALTLDSKSTIFLLMIAAILWGSFFFGNVALREVPQLTITLHRVAQAASLLAPIVFFNGIEFLRSLRVWLA